MAIIEDAIMVLDEYEEQKEANFLASPDMTYTELLDSLNEIKEDLSQAIMELPLNEAFTDAVHIIRRNAGRLIFIGMGKSGMIARKGAATFSSTGVPAFFVHASEALHGDLGMLTADDIVIILSKSGETREISELIPHFKRMGIFTIGITNSRHSFLGQNVDIVLLLGIAEKLREFCPLDMAPTTSTTLMLILCDLLAVSCMKLSGFKKSDFLRLHPGGSLGKAGTCLQVRDIMVDDLSKLPLCRVYENWATTLSKMNECGFGISLFVDNNNTLCGVLTDGDIRRIMSQTDERYVIPNYSLPNWKPYEYCENKGFITVRANDLISEVIHLMERNKILGIPVVNEDGEVIGCFNIHQILSSRYV